MTRTDHAFALLSSSDSVEWYTPAHIIERARAVLGGIDVDPASCAVANETVQATCYYTAEQDGLLRPWRGRVWLNPPYGAAIGPWAARLHQGYATGEIAAALALVPSRPDTRWWWCLRDYPVCFLRGRLRFGDGDQGAPFSSAVLYLGPAPDQFTRVFGEVGLVYMPVPQDAGTMQLPLPLFEGQP